MNAFKNLGDASKVSRRSAGWLRIRSSPRTYGNGIGGKDSEVSLLTIFGNLVLQTASTKSLPRALKNMPIRLDWDQDGVCKVLCAVLNDTLREGDIVIEVHRENEDDAGVNIISNWCRTIHGVCIQLVLDTADSLPPPANDHVCIFYSEIVPASSSFAASAGPQKLDTAQWCAALRNIAAFQIFSAQKRPIQIDRQGSVMAGSYAGKPHRVETETFECKHPNDLMLSFEEVMDRYAWTVCEMLNSGPEVEVVIGVFDSTGEVIGFHLRDDEEDERLLDKTAEILQPIFPPLNYIAEAVTVGISEVVGSVPDDWEERLLCSESLTAQEGRDALVLFSGRACLSKREGERLYHLYVDGNVLKNKLPPSAAIPFATFDELLNLPTDESFMNVPTENTEKKGDVQKRLDELGAKLGACTWTTVDRKKASQIERRVLVRLAIRVPIAFARSFFRAGDPVGLVKRTMKIPFSLSSASKAVVRYAHEIQVWLRLRSASWSVEAQMPLLDSLYVKLLFCSREQEGILRDSLPSEYGRVDFDFSFTHSSQLLTTTSLQRRSEPRLLVADDASIEAVSQFQACDARDATLILLLHPSMLRSSAKQFFQVVRHLRGLSEIHLLATVTSQQAMDGSLAGDVLAGPNGVSLDVHASMNPLFEWISSSPAGAYSFSMVRDAAKKWLRCEKCVPPLAVLEYGVVAFTSQVRMMVEEIREKLSHGSRGCVQEVVRLKLYAGSGATALLRRSAWELRRFAHVLWLIRPPEEEKMLQLELEQQCDRAIRLEMRYLVIAADDHVSARWSMFRRVVGNVVKMKLLPCCIAAVSNCKIAGLRMVPVSPFLRKEDVSLLVSALDHTVCDGNDKARGALYAARDVALAANATPFDLHIFTFCLSVTRGRYLPAKEWVRLVHEEVKKQSADCLNIANAVAFFSAFVVPSNWSSAGMPLQPQAIDILAKCNNHPLGFFQFDYVSRPDIALCRCVHPFLARLYLSHALSISFDTPWSDLDVLHQCFMKWCALLPKLAIGIGDFVREVLRQLVVERSNRRTFTPLVSQYIERPIPIKSDLQKVAQRLTTLDSMSEVVKTELGIHFSILKARAARYLALRCRSDVRIRELLLKQSIVHARAAVDSKHPELVALQNLAVMYGNGSLHTTDEGMKKRWKDESLQLLQQLMERPDLDSSTRPKLKNLFRLYSGDKDKSCGDVEELVMPLPFEQEWFAPFSHFFW